MKMAALGVRDTLSVSLSEFASGRGKLTAQLRESSTHLRAAAAPLPLELPLEAVPRLDLLEAAPRLDLLEAALPLDLLEAAPRLEAALDPADLVPLPVAVIHDLSGTTTHCTRPICSRIS